MTSIHKKLGFLAFAVLCSSQSFALEIPLGSAKDHRIQHVMYDPNDVFKVVAAKGVSLLILLDPNEKIERSSTGVWSDCKEGAEWCIVAEKGDNKIWVKPFSKAQFTDMQLTTDAHVYSFEFNAVNLPKKIGDAPTFRIAFDFPAPPPDPHAGEPTLAQIAMMKELRLKQTLNAPKVFKHRNDNYTMQVVGDSSGIAPSETFDDGRFTYLRFPNNRDVPAIFTILGDGTEKQVTHFWEKDTDYLVVEKVYKRLILRKDSLTVGIWNESYDPEGVPAVDGTTVDSVKRVVK
ncbi:MAG TPA: TrbG/VirB9 family P-type conjugative transfer protein [Methylobacter sp.]|jgi:type IV secretion system protein VirB9